MMVAVLHSNGQLRTERDGDTEKGSQKPAVQPKTTDDALQKPTNLTNKIFISQLLFLGL